MSYVINEDINRFVKAMGRKGYKDVFWRPEEDMADLKTLLDEYFKYHFISGEPDTGSFTIKTVTEGKLLDPEMTVLVLNLEYDKTKGLKVNQYKVLIWNKKLRSELNSKVVKISSISELPDIQTVNQMLRRPLKHIPKSNKGKGI